MLPWTRGFWEGVLAGFIIGLLVGAILVTKHFYG